MAKFVCLKAFNLDGIVRTGPNLSVETISSNQSVMRALGFVNKFSKVECLFLACHGFESIVHCDSTGQSQQRGGFGLDFGLEKVKHENVSMWEAIAGRCKNIVVYSCAAADTGPKARGTAGDGKYLMGALAIHTQATVYAARDTQEYNSIGGQYIDFGDWEGPLYRFSSDGTPAKIVAEAPYNLIDLRSISDKIADALVG